jgi:hypothetical protein
MQVLIPCGHRIQELNVPDDRKEVALDHVSNAQEATSTTLSQFGRGASIGITPYSGLVLSALTA